MANEHTPTNPRLLPALVPPAAPPGSPRPLTDFARRVVVAVLITLLLLALAYMLWRGAHVLLEAFAGVLFAVFLSALSDWLSKHTRLSYGWSLCAVVVALFVLAGGLAWLFARQIAAQVAELLQTLPKSFEEIRASLAQYSWGQYLLEHVPQAQKALGEAGGFSRVTGLISGVADFLVAALVILIVGIFGAAEPGLYKAGLFHLVPRAQRPRAGQALEAVTFNLQHWLLGQIALMVIIGATTAVGLWLMGIPLALTLGLLTGVMELIPYVGAWLSAIPALLMAVLVSPLHVVMVAGLFLFLHVLEGYVLFPLIQRRAVHLPPALTLVAQVLLGELLGVLGLFVAAPLTVVAVVLLKMLYVEDTLGDQNIAVPGEPGNGVHKAAAGAR